MKTHSSQFAPSVNQAELSEYFPREKFLEAITSKLRKTLGEDLPAKAHDPEILIKAAQHLCLAEGAKRIRSQFVFFIAKALSVNMDIAIEIAAAAELIHAASLLHDDVIDESPLRRGKATANARWSNKVAVLAGDLVLSLAINQLAKYAPAIHTSAVEVVLDMTRAAMHEVQARGCAALSLEQWFKIADGKTAQLFGWCGFATGSMQKGQPEVAKKFGECGYRIGMAFQMADDIKDILDRHSGKDYLSDLKNRNPNFVVIQAMEEQPEILRKLFQVWQQQTVSQAQALELKELVLTTQAVEKSIARLQQEINQAIFALGSYQEITGGQEIVALARLIVQRVQAMATVTKK